MSRNAGMVERWPTALLPTIDVDDVQEAANSSGGFPENPHVLRVRRMHPEETKVHRRGLMWAPDLAANHEAQPPLDPS